MSEHNKLTLNDLLDMWDEDSKIDRGHLDNDSIRRGQLHAKYIRLLANNQLKLQAKQHQLAKLVKTKHEYYNGLLDQQTLKELGWEPNRLKILKSDVQIYLDGDQQLIEMKIAVAVQREIVDTLKAILNQINTRNYDIRNAIEYTKFINGG